MIDEAKRNLLLTWINKLFQRIRGDWSDPRWECRQGWEAVNRLELLLGITDKEGYRNNATQTEDEYYAFVKKELGFAQIFGKPKDQTNIAIPGEDIGGY